MPDINGTPPIINPQLQTACPTVLFDCLDDIIGLRGCSDGGCYSYYIDDIGFTQEQLANIASLEAETSANNILQNAIKIAKERVVNDVFRSGEVRVKERISNCIAGEFLLAEKDGVNIDEKYFTPNIGEGLRIDNNFYDVYRTKINSISFDTEEAVTMQFYIIDGNYSYLYETQTVAKGATKIFINRTFLNRYVYIVWANTASRLRSTQSYPTNSIYNRYGSSCEPCRCGTDCDFVGWEQATGIANGSTTYGFKVDYDICCDMNEIVCHFKYDISELFRYAVASELSERHHISMRINSESLDDKRNEYRTQLWQKKYANCYDSTKKRINRELKTFCPDCIKCYGNRTAYINP